MSDCKHKLHDMDTACVDGICPLCQADELTRLRGIVEKLGDEFEAIRLRAEEVDKRSNWRATSARIALDGIVKIARDGIKLASEQARQQEGVE